MKKQVKIALIIAGVLCALAIIIYGVFTYLEKKIVKETVEQGMQQIKELPTDEQAMYYLNMVTRQIDNQMLADLVQSYFEAEDVRRAYGICVSHMEYEVTKVEKKGWKHYVVTVHVENVNMIEAMQFVAGELQNAYEQKGLIEQIMQGVKDIISVANGEMKERMLTSLQRNVDDLAKEDAPIAKVTGDFALEVYEENGEWQLLIEDEQTDGSTDNTNLDNNGENIDLGIDSGMAKLLQTCFGIKSEM